MTNNVPNIIRVNDYPGYELTFAVYEGYAGGYTAIEGKIGLVAMAEDIESLHKAVYETVEIYLKQIVNQQQNSTKQT